MEPISLNEQIAAIRKKYIASLPCLVGCSSLDQVRYTLTNMQKKLLGSAIPVKQFEPYFGELEELLAMWTVFFLEDGDYSICQTFYHYALLILCSEELGDQTIDDLLKLADTFAPYPDVFVLVGEGCLEPERYQSLKDWGKEHSYFSVSTADFHNAVLGAICVLTGVLPDPYDKESAETKACSVELITSPAAFTFDFDSALHFKAELEKEVPGICDKLSVMELDKVIDFVERKTREEFFSQLKGDA